MTTKYRINSWLGLITLLFASAPASISAAELFVSTIGNDTNVASYQSPVATIQRGIALASNGDTVWINPGTYSGEGNRNIDLMGKAVTVKSVAGPKSVTLDLQQNRAFLANSSESLATVIDGFTIVGGYAITGQDWGGIAIISINSIASLTIKNCIFTNNRVEISYFTARANIIEDNSNSGSVIENCLFYENTCRGGYWMTTSFSNIIYGRFTKSRSLTIANNYLESNYWGSWSPGGLPVAIWESGGSFHSSIVRGNGNSNIYCAYSPTTPSHSMTDGTIIDPASGVAYSTGYTQIDPLFASPQNGDFSLAPGSPAIDAGDPSVVDPDGTRSDIGFNLARAQSPRSQIMSFTATTGGTLTGTGEYDQGTTATLTATPNPGYRFTGWTDDASGTDNPLTITMDADKTVGASFEQDLSDADADGLTAYDEVTLYHTDPTKADSDNDGLTDAYELGIGRFSAVSGSRTWAQAKTDAETQGGTLATFANQDEWNLAMQSIGSDALLDVGGLWIGATDEAVEGTWAWVTGEPFIFTLWETGQPDNGSNSDYAAVAGDLGGNTGKWYDYRAATSRDGYILESGYSTNPSDADSDDDGLLDGAERAAGTNPFNADTDADGLTDAQEVNLTHTNPKLADSNSNGINDALDDQDSDGLTNLAEITQYGTDPAKADTDGDGLTDLVELGRNRFVLVLPTSPLTFTQAMAGARNQGGYLATFASQAEYDDALAQIPPDTLLDVAGLWIGASDEQTEGQWRWLTGEQFTFTKWALGEPNNTENSDYAAIAGDLGGELGSWYDYRGIVTRDGYILEKSFITDPLLADTDGDGISDSQEIGLRTSPNVADTDGDGSSDGSEIEFGGDPLIPSMSPQWKANLQNQNSSSGFELRFPTRAGEVYQIEACSDLINWSVLETGIQGTGSTLSRTYASEGRAKRYFRVQRN